MIFYPFFIFVFLYFPEYFSIVQNSITHEKKKNIKREEENDCKHEFNEQFQTKDWLLTFINSEQ